MAAEKWMTGDWHQHTTFTDGSNIMVICRSIAPPRRRPSPSSTAPW
jgi:hypothetical protein